MQLVVVVVGRSRFLKSGDRRKRAGPKRAVQTFQSPMMELLKSKQAVRPMLRALKNGSLDLEFDRTYLKCASDCPKVR